MQHLLNGARSYIYEVSTRIIRKSLTGFQLVLYLATLNDLTRRNGHYFELLRWIS